MHLPNHPDLLFEFVKALKDCGYRWLLVQEHTVETASGEGLSSPHLPHRLVAQNSTGEKVEIIALIKTQGSDTKLVGQMQPYWEAKTLRPQPIGDRSAPPLVTQISDGENGGVMMNEFPSAFRRSWYEMREAGGGQSGTVGFNGTEYLELLEAEDITPEQFPLCQARGQHRLWQAVGTPSGPDAVAEAISALKEQDPNFSMEGGSWTNDRSWVSGYDNVLAPPGEVECQISSHHGKPIDPWGSDTPAPATALSQCFSSQPAPANQLFSLLGPGHLDRLCSRNLPPRQRYPRP